jgi:hypothetical protein
MLGRMWRVGTVGLCGVVLAAAGCGGEEEDGPTPGGLAREASVVIEELEGAIAAGEFERICSTLLSAEVRRQAGGGECPAMLARTSGGLERPRIEVKEIRIEGATATVDVVTAAAGQARVPDTIRLVREEGGYRISSLSG